jgi:hypothetical protein
MNHPTLTHPTLTHLTAINRLAEANRTRAPRPVPAPDPQDGPAPDPQDGPAPDRLGRGDRERLLAAAYRALASHPGPVGELIHQELLSWQQFGYRLGTTGRVMRLVEEVLRTPIPPAAA